MNLNLNFHIIFESLITKTKASPLKANVLIIIVCSLNDRLALHMCDIFFYVEKINIK